MKRITIQITVILTLTVLLGINAYASAPEEVKLPQFDVTINDVVIDNDMREYPFIVYKDITYFPMTYYDCRYLGVATSWDSKKGLSVWTDDITGSYYDYLGDEVNRLTDTAIVPTYDIRINGQEIDNEAERYPLLSYRNVTYFPLTWRYAHDSFGWKYNWSDKGLEIASDNPQLTKLPLEEWSTVYQVAYDDGYYYYSEEYSEDDGSKSYRAIRQKEDFTSAPETIYDIKSGYWGSNFYNIFYESVNGSFWLKYKNSRQEETCFRVDQSGDVEKIMGGSKDEFIMEDGYLYIDKHHIGGGSSIVWTDGENKEIVTENTYTYGIGNNGIPGRVVDDSLYTLRESHGDDTESKVENQLVCLDYDAKEELIIIDAGVNWFDILGDRIIFQKLGDPVVYLCNKDGSGIEIFCDDWPEGITSQQWIYNDSVMMVHKDEETKKYSLYKVSEDNAELIYSSSGSSFYHSGNWVTVISENKREFGAMVFDIQTDSEITIGDPIEFEFLNEDRLIFKNTESNKIYVLDLEKVLSSQSTNEAELSTIQTQTEESVEYSIIELEVPDWASKNDVGYYDGYYYFLWEIALADGTRSYQVYRSRCDDNEELELILENNVSPTEDDIYYSYEFYESDGCYWLQVYKGTGIQGITTYYRVNADGSTVLDETGRYDFVAVDGGHLFILNDTGLGVDLGDGDKYFDNVKDIYFGKTIYPIGSTGGITISRNDYATVIEDRVYLQATERSDSYEAEDRLLNALVSVDYKTGEFDVVLKDNITFFNVIGDRLIYQKHDDRHVYTCDLNGMGEQELFGEVIDGKVRYCWVWEDIIMLSLIMEDDLDFLESVYRVVKGSAEHVGIIDRDWYKHSGAWVAFNKNESKDDYVELLNIETEEVIIIDEPVEVYDFSDSRLLMRDIESDKVMIVVVD